MVYEGRQLTQAREDEAGEVPSVKHPKRISDSSRESLSIYVTRGEILSAKVLLTRQPLAFCLGVFSMPLAEVCRSAVESAYSPYCAQWKDQHLSRDPPDWLRMRENGRSFSASVLFEVPLVFLL
jgi:hypothetical protein